MDNLSVQILVRREQDGGESDIHDWLCIHDTRANGAKVKSPSLLEERNKTSILTFYVYPHCPALDLLKLENQDKCEVWVCERAYSEVDPWTLGYRYPRYHGEGNNIWRADVFVGHVVEFSPEYDTDGLLTYKVMCADHREYLSKTVQPRREYSLAADPTHPWGGGARGGFVDFIGVHNDEIDVYRGAFGRKRMDAQPDITIDDYNEYHYIVDWENTEEAIRERFIERFGGEMYVDNNEYCTERGEFPPIYQYGTTLRWTKKDWKHSDVAIEKGKNLKMLTIATDNSELCTRIYPLGATLEDGSRVTIKGVSVDGHDINVEYIDIDDAEYIQEHGVTAKVVEWSDVTQPINLYYKALDWLDTENRIKQMYTAQVLDLSVIKNPLERFRLREWHRIIHPDMNVDVELQIIRIEYDLEQLQNVELTFGDRFLNYEQEQVKNEVENTRVIQSVIYNSNAVATKLENEQKLLTSEQETSGGDMAHSTLSGKEISTEWWNGAQRMGKIGFEADKEGLVGYSGSSQAPSILITHYGEIITDGNLTLRGAYSDVLINIDGQYVSLRDYIRNHN